MHCHELSWSSSPIHFKNWPKYLTFQVFIPLMRFLLLSLLSRSFLVPLKYFSFISTCLMMFASNIPKYLQVSFLQMFWFFIINFDKYHLSSINISCIFYSNSIGLLSIQHKNNLFVWFELISPFSLEKLVNCISCSTTKLQYLMLLQISKSYKKPIPEFFSQFCWAS